MYESSEAWKALKTLPTVFMWTVEMTRCCIVVTKKKRNLEEFFVSVVWLNSANEGLILFSRNFLKI